MTRLTDVNQFVDDDVFDQTRRKLHRRPVDPDGPRAISESPSEPEGPNLRRTSGDPQPAGPLINPRTQPGYASLRVPIDDGLQAVV